MSRGFWWLGPPLLAIALLLLLHFAPRSGAIEIAGNRADALAPDLVTAAYLAYGFHA